MFGIADAGLTNGLWLVYRIARGWLLLEDGRLAPLVA